MAHAQKNKKVGYKIVEGFDHYNNYPLYQVSDDGSNDEIEYVGEYHISKADAEKELAELKMAKGGKLKSFFSKAKEVGGKAYEKGREVAHYTKEKAKEGMHNASKKNTMGVLNEVKEDRDVSNQDATNIEITEDLVQEHYQFEPTPFVPKKEMGGSMSSIGSGYSINKQDWSDDTKKIIESISEIRYDRLPPIEQRTMSQRAYEKILIDATKYAIKTLYRDNADIFELQKATREAGGNYHKAFVDLYGENLTYAEGGSMARGGSTNYTKSGHSVNGKVIVAKHPQGHFLIIDEYSYQIGENFKTEQDAYSYARNEGMRIKGDSYAKGGFVNKEFLSNQTSDYTNRILQSIADYYGTTKSKIQKELYDDDAEMIYEYIGNDRGLRKLVYDQMESFKYRNNYAKGGNVGGKPQRTDLIAYYIDNHKIDREPPRVDTIECSVYVNHEHQLEAEINECLNNRGIYNSKIKGYKIVGKNPHNFSSKEVSKRPMFNKGGEVLVEVGSHYYDTRYDKPFKVVFIDGEKMGIEYIDKKTQSTESKTIDRSEFDYYVKNGAWNKYTQPFIYAKGGMTKSMEVDEVMQDHFANGGSLPNNFMVSAYDVSYTTTYPNGRGGSNASLMYDGYEDYDRNGDLIYDVEDSYNEALKEYNKISEKMFYEGDVVDYVELKALGEYTEKYKDFDDWDYTNNFGFTIIKSKGTSPYDRKREGEFADGGSVGKNITYSATFDLMDADGNEIDNPMPTLQFGVSSDVSYGDAKGIAQRTYESGNFFEEGMKAEMTDFWMGEMDAEEEDRRRVEIREQEEREEFVPKVERSGKWDSSYSVLCDELATYEMGGDVKDFSYEEDILPILKESIDDGVDEIDDYENVGDAQGEEVEYKSRSGFIPYTDGGYEKKWFEYISTLNGSGTSLPTKVLDDEMQRQVDNAYEYAKERFIEDNEELVEEIGEEKVNYSDLYELEMGEKAEELSEMEMDMGDDSIMMSVKAFYYNPSNSRAENNQHTITLIGDVNLEAPYHRSGNMDDYKEITFTFNSKKELEDKMSENMEHIIDWFGGDGYSESTREMKVRRMAKGGSTYAEGGTIIKKGNRVRVVNTQYDGKEGLVVSNDLHNGNYQVQIDGKVKGFPFENLMLLSRDTYEEGGEIDSFSEYQVFYNDEEMIKVIKDKSSQDAYNVSYLGLLENDELPSVIDEVLNNRRKLSKSESEDLYRKLKDKRGIEIRNVVDGKSTDKRGKKIITPSEFRKILKDLGFKVSFKRNSLGVFAIVKDSEGKELPTIFMGEEHRKKWLPVIELKKQYSIEKDYEKVFFAEGGSMASGGEIPYSMRAMSSRLMDSGFKHIEGTPNNELRNDDINARAVITEDGISVRQNLQNSTYRTMKDLVYWLKRNRLYSKGGSTYEEGGNVEYNYFEVENNENGEISKTYERTNIASPNIPNAKKISKEEYEKNIYAKGGATENDKWVSVKFNQNYDDNSKEYPLIMEYLGLESAIVGGSVDVIDTDGVGIRFMISDANETDIYKMFYALEDSKIAKYISEVNLEDENGNIIEGYRINSYAKGGSMASGGGIGRKEWEKQVIKEIPKNSDYDLVDAENIIGGYPDYFEFLSYWQDGKTPKETAIIVLDKLDGSMASGGEIKNTFAVEKDGKYYDYYDEKWYDYYDEQSLFDEDWAKELAESKGGNVVNTDTFAKGGKLTSEQYEKELRGLKKDLFDAKQPKAKILIAKRIKDIKLLLNTKYGSTYAKGGWLENSIFDSKEEALADYEQYTWKHRFTKGITAKVIGITNSGVKIRVTEENDWNENKLRKPRKRTFALPIRDFMETYKWR